MHPHAARIASCFALLSLTACKPPTPQELKEEAATNMSALLEEAYDSAVVSTSSSTQLTSFINALNVTVASTGGSMVTRPALPQRTSDAQSTITSMKKFVGERIFSEQNIESTGVGDVTFLINGRRFCESSETRVADATCVGQIDSMQLRLVVSGDPRGTLTIRLNAGVQRKTAATLIFENGHALQLEVDAAEISGLASSLPNANLSVGSASGLVQVRLEKLGPGDFALTYSVLRELRSSFTINGVTRSTSMAPSIPTYRVRVNSAKAIHELSVDLGRMTWDGPWGDFDGSSGATPLHAELSGFKFDFSTDAAPSMARSTLSLGAGTNVATVGGVEIASLSLRAPITGTLVTANDGRLRLNLTDVDGTAAFHLARAPGMHSNAAFDDATYRLTFSASPALGLGKANDALALQVLSGQFMLSQQEVGRSIVAGTGLCLGRPAAPPQGELPLFASFGALACQ